MKTAVTSLNYFRVNLPVRSAFIGLKFVPQESSLSTSPRRQML